MALGTPTLLDFGKTDTDGTSRAAAAISPANGDLVIAGFGWSKASAPDAATISDTGGNTWTTMGTTSHSTSGSPLRRLIAHWAIWNGAAGSVITWDFAGVTQTGFIHNVLGITGAHQTVPIVTANSVAGVNNTSVTTKSLTYNQAFASGSIGILLLHAQAATSAPGVSGSWQNITSSVQTTSTPVAGMFMQYVMSDPTTGAPTWTGSGTCGMRMWEIQPPAAGGGAKHRVTNSGIITSVVNGGLVS